MSQEDTDINRADQSKLTTTDEAFVKHKKDKIKEAAKKGNRAKARREAIELLQYLGKGTNEMPIEGSLEEFR